MPFVYLKILYRMDAGTQKIEYQSMLPNHN